MFSIIIPLYNKQNAIKATLDSVLCQTFFEFEVIVVDDGSTDDSFIRAKETEDGRIRFIQKQNGGVCTARNRGIIEAKYNYIAFLDADDTWDEKYLAEQKRLIIDFPEAALWGINFAPVSNGENIYLSTGLAAGYRGIVQNYFSIKKVSDLFHSSSVVVKKNVFDITGFFDERIKYSEDIDMWYRIVLNFPVVFYDKIMVYYQQDAENRAMMKSHKVRDSLLFYIDKYKGYRTNEIFNRFINRWASVRICTYYFEIKGERKDASIAAKKLDYSVLPTKYKYLFKTPFLVGKIVYHISKMMRNLFNR